MHRWENGACISCVYCLHLEKNDFSKLAPSFLCLKSFCDFLCPQEEFQPLELHSPALITRAFTNLISLNFLSYSLCHRPGFSVFLPHVSCLLSLTPWAFAQAPAALNEKPALPLLCFREAFLRQCRLLPQDLDHPVHAPIFKTFSRVWRGCVCFCTSRSSAGLWTLKEQKWLLFFWCPQNLGPLQARDRNWERAEWMTEWVHVTSRLAGSKNSLPKEYFNGFSSATTLTTPFSIPLKFHRLCNNLSPGLKRPITLVRLLLAGATPGSKGPLEQPLRSHTWTHAVGFYSDLFIAAYSFLLVCKMISMWFVDF